MTKNKVIPTKVTPTKVNLMLRNSVAAFTLVLASISVSKADVVVRDSQTSDDEFQAEALALGHTPISNWLGNEEHRAISSSLKQIFEARLIDAQSAWIRRASQATDIAAIDRLLDLEIEADWSSSEREAFVVFANRKTEVRPREILRPAINRDLKPEFPSDVNSILFNGREIRRIEFGSIEFPERPTRVTLLSDVYAPATVKLSGYETKWPEVERKAWVTENCAQIVVPFTDAPVSILASNRCRDTLLKIAPATPGDRELIEKFGIDRLRTEPLREPVKQTNFAQRPWVWAAVGLLAVGAAIAFERNQNQASLQPVAREGW